MERNRGTGDRFPAFEVHSAFGVGGPARATVTTWKQRSDPNLEQTITWKVRLHDQGRRGTESKAQRAPEARTTGERPEITDQLRPERTCLGRSKSVRSGPSTTPQTPGAGTGQPSGGNLPPTTCRSRYRTERTNRVETNLSGKVGERLIRAN